MTVYICNDYAPYGLIDFDAETNQPYPKLNLQRAMNKKKFMIFLLRFITKSISPPLNLAELQIIDLLSL